MLNSIKNQKLVNLLKIEKYRCAIEQAIKANILTNEDILELLNVDINYGLDINRCRDNKERMMKTIYNAPFILCDIDLFDKNMKQVIYSLLKYRYEIELKEINYDLEQCYIGEEEYNEKIEMLVYNYFYTSEEGRLFFEEEVQKQKQL